MKKHINRFGARTVTAVAAMIFAAQAAWALEPFKVQDIRVEGLQRVEPGTVFASMSDRSSAQTVSATCKTPEFTAKCLKLGM